MLSDYGDVLTVKELAAALGVGVNSAYKLVHDREIGSRRIGSKILVPKVCVKDYLNSTRYMTKKQ